MEGREVSQVVNDWIAAYEPTLRLSCFVGLFALFALAEWMAPRRERKYSRALRWSQNLILVGLNSLALRLLLPLLAIDVALICESRSWGLLAYVPLPYWTQVLLGFLALDLAIYWQHRIFHEIPVLFRIHRMHHADLEFDVSTGARFHPIEIFLSMFIKMIVVLFLGIPVLAVLTFEIMLNATSMFTHSNLKIPSFVDTPVRYLFVTPDMHRIHHSTLPKELNSNYGFNLSIWDRWFDSYQQAPRDGHRRMKIGLNRFRDIKFLTLPWMLKIPFIDR